MNTIEIPRVQWSEQLNELSRRHEGQPVSVEVLSDELGAQTEVRDLPLLGLIVDPPDRGDAITIAAARSKTEHIDHAVQAPTRVWLEQNEEGADVALEIEAKDGIKTILRFTVPSA